MFDFMFSSLLKDNLFHHSQTSAESMHHMPSVRDLYKYHKGDNLFIWAGINQKEEITYGSERIQESQ